MTDDSHSGVPDAAAPQAVTAQVAPRTHLDRVLGVVPRVLSSHAHILFLIGLGVYLVLLPLFGVKVSPKSELIGGNYTNVTSDVAASIAAGLTVHLVRRDRSRRKQLEELLSAVEVHHAQLHGKVDVAVTAAKRAEEAATRAAEAAAGEGGGRPA